MSEINDTPVGAGQTGRSPLNPPTDEAMAPLIATARKSRGLPGLALAALYVLAAATPLAIAAASGIESAGAWTETATATGMLGAVMLILQLVSSGRFEQLSGRIGIDVTMAFHKWAARAMVVLVLLHPLLFLAPVAPDRLGAAFNHLIAMLGSPRYLSGVVALAAIVAVVLLAMFRDWLPVRYEAWRASHSVMALLATWATLAHLAAVGTYSAERALLVFWLALAAAATAAALGVYTVRAWRMRHQDWRATGIRRLAERLWELTIAGAGERLPFRAGQFAWLAFAPRRFPLFDHPFSICAPGKTDELCFIIQEAGDFTNAIGSLPIGTRVGLDGPHGSFTLEGMEADAVLLVAGGVGVAPILSVLRDLAASGDPRPVRLVYGARNPAAAIDAAEFRPSLARLDARATFLVDTPSPDWTHDVGPVTEERLRQALAGLEPARVAAMVCGPGAMMTAVTESLHRLGLPYGNIRYERFDYAGGALSGKDRRTTAGFWLMALAIAAAGAAFAFR